MPTLEVIRRRPPDVQRCKGKDCTALIEWVIVGFSGKAMPVTAPLVPLGERVGGDGVRLTIIEGPTVHFNTCPAAQAFRRPPRPNPRRRARLRQLALFEKDPDR